MAIELVSRYGVNKNHNFIKLVKFLQIHNIWHRNLSDITTNDNSIMKVKEYRFHIPIYHIFWELQFAELLECIAVSKLPGLDPVSGSAMAVHPSYGQVGSPSNPELYVNSRTGSGDYTKDSRTWPSRM
jgi:hypothetical protein